MPLKNNEPLSETESRDWLKSSDLFKHISPDDVFWNSINPKSKIYADKARIIKTGMLGGSLYLIYKGRVIVKFLEDNILDINQGDFFGELELAYSGKALMFDTELIASKTSQDGEIIIIEIRQDDLNDLIKDDSAFKIKIMFAIQKRVRHLHGFLANYKNDSIAQRIAFALKLIFDGFYPLPILDSKLPRNTFQLPCITIASLAMAAPEYTHKILTWFMIHERVIMFNFLSERIYMNHTTEYYSNTDRKILDDIDMIKKLLCYHDIRNAIIEKGVNIIYYPDMFFNLCTKKGFKLNNLPEPDLPLRPNTYTLSDPEKLKRLASGGISVSHPDFKDYPLPKLI